MLTILKAWLEPGSNRRHADFQSAALPAELSSQVGNYQRDRMTTGSDCSQSDTVFLIPSVSDPEEFRSKISSGSLDGRRILFAEKCRKDMLLEEKMDGKPIRKFGPKFNATSKWAEHRTCYFFLCPLKIYGTTVVQDAQSQDIYPLHDQPESESTR
jgi:hypothetical protein